MSSTSGNEQAIEIIEQHIPSLTDNDDVEIAGRIWEEWGLTADFALRTCACGVRIDGFYEYVDHLKDVLR